MLLTKFYIKKFITAQFIKCVTKIKLNCLRKFGTDFLATNFDKFLEKDFFLNEDPIPLLSTNRITKI